MRYAICADPETGYSICVNSPFYRRQSKKFPDQIQICEIEASLVERFRVATEEYDAVQKLISAVFQAALTAAKPAGGA